MNVVKEGFVLYLIDSGLPSGNGKPRPPVNGYFNDRPFEFDKKRFPRCCPILTKSAKVYSSYNYAYSSGDAWKEKCLYVDAFKIEMVGVTDTGELTLLDNVVEEEMRARSTPFLPQVHRDLGVVKTPSDMVLGKGIPYTLPGGDTILLYTRNQLAVALGRGSLTVRKWEISDVIPDSGFRGKNGEALYSKEQIAIVVKSAERARLSSGRPLKNTHFKRWVHLGFDRLKSHHESKKEE